MTNIESTLHPSRAQSAADVIKRPNPGRYLKPELLSGFETDSTGFVRLMIALLGKETTRDLVNIYQAAGKPINNVENHEGDIFQHDSLYSSNGCSNGHSEEFDYAPVKKALARFYKEHFPFLPDDPKQLGFELQRYAAEANAVVEYFRALAFPDSEGKHSLLNPIQTPSSESLLTMEVLLLNGSVDNRYKYEAYRQLLIMYILLLFEKKRRLTQIEDKINTINSSLERELFDGPIGHLVEQDLYSVHDDHTNRCLGYSTNKPERAGRGRHIKHQKMHFRVLKDSEGEESKIFYHYREKKNTSNVAKAIMLSLTDNLPISVDNVKDHHGSLFALESRRDLEALYHQVLELVLRMPECEFIYEDNQTGNERGQSSIKWRRIQAVFKDVPYPVEMVFFLMDDYLNYHLQVGHMVNGTVSYEKPLAHRAFELRRAFEVSTMLFPDSIYSTGDTDWEGNYEYAKQSIIYDLREKYRLKEVGSQSLAKRIKRVFRPR